MMTRVMLLGSHSATLRSALTTAVASSAFEIVADAATTRAVADALRDPGGQLRADAAIVSADCVDGDPGAGFAQVAALPRERRPRALLLVSHREEDAVKAFELDATDFLTEPLSEARLRTALARMRHTVLRDALLRTADELQRLLAESVAAGVPGVPIPHVEPRRPPEATDGPRNGRGHAEAGGRAAPVGAAVMVHAAAPRTVEEVGITTSPTRSGPGRGFESTRNAQRSVLVREGRRTRYVPLAEVDWFEADGNYIVVHAGDQQFRTRGTINSIEAGLDPRQFARIHRRVVVNMDRVRELSPLPGGDGLLRLGDGATLRLSRTYRSRVR